MTQTIGSVQTLAMGTETQVEICSTYLSFFAVMALAHTCANRLGIVLGALFHKGQPDPFFRSFAASARPL